jgi:hypothetical protein
MRRVLRMVAIAAALLAILVIGRCSLRTPSNDRNWNADQVRLSTASFNGPLVTIRNVRNFTYRSESDFTPAYYDKTYDLRQLNSVWFVVEPFGEFEGPAHTFVSFGFDDRDFVAISVEIRKEVGESFSPWKGLLRHYEIMYVVGDERDLVALRANHRKDEVFVYRVNTTTERMRKLFVEMLTRANAVAEKPEFYNTLTNTCTTNIVRHVNTVNPRRVPWRLGVFLPGYSGELAYRLGLLDTNIPFEELKERSRVNEKAARFATDPEFSRKIRGID